MTARDQATMAEAREQAVRHAYNQASGHYLPDPLMTECPVCSARFVPAGWLSPAEVADREAAAEQRGREKAAEALERIESNTYGSGSYWIGVDAAAMVARGQASTPVARGDHSSALLDAATTEGK